jgi:hypothetical protein
LSRREEGVSVWQRHLAWATTVFAGSATGANALIDILQKLF